MIPARSPIGPTGGAERDPVLRAQILFLQALCENLQPRDPRAKALMNERRRPITEEARNRCRNDGHAIYAERKWSITEEGRAWLAALLTPLATTEDGR